MAEQPSLIRDQIRCLGQVTYVLEHQSSKRLLATMQPDGPSRGCSVCGTAQLRLTINTRTATLGRLVSQARPVLWTTQTLWFGPCVLKTAVLASNEAACELPLSAVVRTDAPRNAQAQAEVTGKAANVTPSNLTYNRFHNGRDGWRMY